MAPEFSYQDLLPIGEDKTEYRLLSSDGIATFSADGKEFLKVSPAVHESAAARNLKTIDATCPLVTKVHNEARRFASDDYDILLVGHEGHEEVDGTAGETP